MFNSLEEAINWIYTRKKENKRYKLKDMSDALMSLNIKKDDLKIIHIGGTNGKGSTCSALTNILVKSGYKVGRYVSPFVVKFNERISINEEYISDNDLFEYINYFYDFNERFSENHDSLSFFELITLISIKYFYDNKVDLVVFEVGLGGRLDATNVVTPIISAVTNVQKDHMKELGNTYLKILEEKIGIMKPNVPFVTTIQKTKLIKRIKEKSNELNSPLYLVYKPNNINISLNKTTFKFEGIEYTTNLIGYHQAYNMSLVIKICHVLRDMYNINISDTQINVGINTVSWPGRFETIDDYILDGGHNKEGIEAVSKTIKDLNFKKVCTIFCAMKDKEVKKMINEIESFSDLIIYSKINYYRCDNLDDFIKYTNNAQYLTTENVEEAINMALKYKNLGYKVIFLGSLYFISEVRKMLLGGKNA